MDLTTSYLGIALAHPFMAGASPMVDDLDAVRRLEDAGTSAIVMHSLFEEQLTGEQMAAHQFLDVPADSNAEAGSYLPRSTPFTVGPDEYLEQIRLIREAVAVPVIGSLNGITPGGWTGFARLIEQAGANALELNLYEMPVDPAQPGAAVEDREVEIVAAVVRAVTIPVAVKLSPFYSSLPHFAGRLEQAGARGVVAFNRFYQADIDPEGLDLRPVMQLSTSSELLLRLRAIAVLRAQRNLSLGVSGGVHTAMDAVKAVMAGADVVQMVSALFRQGPQQLEVVRRGFAEWVEAHEYQSVAQLRGSMSLDRCPDPRAYERLSHLRVLQNWRSFV